jgi:hypothetical protein
MPNHSAKYADVATINAGNNAKSMAHVTTHVVASDSTAWKKGVTVAKTPLDTWQRRGETRRVRSGFALFCVILTPRSPEQHSLDTVCGAKYSHVEVRRLLVDNVCLCFSRKWPE